MMRSIIGIAAVLAFAGTNLAQDTEPASPPEAKEPAPTPKYTEDVEVVGRAEDLIGIADSATEGTVGAADLAARPLLRPGELLEAVPGMIVTQHSGAGKANQYFLRGFNLDHGTDFRTTIDGVPINLGSHAHGQGYTDINFLIPELVSRESYRKGPYSAAEGDFSSAGAMDIELIRAMPKPILAATIGNGSYERLLGAGSAVVGGGTLLGAAEAFHDNGPWAVPQNYRRLNGLLRYDRTGDTNSFTVTLMAYGGDWNATDQIPQRAVDAGQLSRFGTVDASGGGESSRYSLTADWRRADGTTIGRLRGFVVRYGLDLFSNFTYFLDDPVNGDQFEQKDDRWIYGFDYSRSVDGKVRGHDAGITWGVQLRRDDIDNGLYATRGRVRLSTTREDDIALETGGAWVEGRAGFTRWFRGTFGLRGDVYRTHVNSDLAANSGRADDALVSPKIALVFTPSRQAELYVNYGWGFHSNDARGAVIAVDPKTGEPATPVDPLVRTEGVDLGARFAPVPQFQSTVSLFALDIDSELVFVGDAGATEAGRPSRRTGIELANFWRCRPWLSFDLDVALSKARFRDNEPQGDYIPGSIATALTGGVAVSNFHKFGGALRVRFFGPRPLNESDTVSSKSSTLLYGDVNYEVARGLRLGIEVFNLLNTKASDIDYLYESRLPSEAAPVEGLHSHPVEPRQIRLRVAYAF